MTQEQAVDWISRCIEPGFVLEEDDIELIAEALIRAETSSIAIGGGHLTPKDIAIVVSTSIAGMAASC